MLVAYFNHRVISTLAARMAPTNCVPDNPAQRLAIQDHDAAIVDDFADRHSYRASVSLVALGSQRSRRQVAGGYGVV